MQTPTLQAVISDVDNGATVTTAKYNPHKIGCISCTNLLHDVGPVYFNSARVDTEAAANFLIGSTLGN
jgi:hypothetical protein